MKPEASARAAEYMVLHPRALHAFILAAGPAIRTHGAHAQTYRSLLIDRVTAMLAIMKLTHAQLLSLHDPINHEFVD